MQLTLFDNQNEDKVLTDLFQAYFDARKNKRNTINALAFEKHFESNIFKLFDEIIEQKYQPKPSICFIVDKPVKREIFAADFFDRIVHHFIFNCISPIVEKTFINDSYSCRIGKGTHYGIHRIDRFIRSCTGNYSQDGYILKLDIKGYFMAMNRKLLFEKVKSVLLANGSKLDFDFLLILYLLEKTIFHDPTENCIIKGKYSDWADLPETKSLFHAKSNCGLPIGNLTSQLFGNIYLNDFDHFVKRDLKIRYYGRYVDDIILVHRDRDYLKALIPIIKEYLKKYLQLELHPKKVYLQHYSKGVKYLGAVIKPHRIYIASRTKGSFYEAIDKQNQIARNHKPTTEEQEKFLSSLNSYLGIMKHYKTYNMRKRMIFKNLSGWWWNYTYLSGGISKFVQKLK
ncbi:MAG: reverse transcriptase domain-containing protein [archaeon]